MTDIAISARVAASRANGGVPPSAEPEFGALVRETWRLMRRNFERRARETELPLTRLQAIALLRISRQQGISQAQLASALEIQPIAVVAILDRLQAMGLIERRRASGDRRVRELWLKPAAKPVLERILGITRGIRQAAFAGFSPGQRKAFFAGFARVKENLSWLVSEEETEPAAAMRKPGPRGSVKVRPAARR